MQKKTETFVYEGLGFPIQLTDVPMKKVLGEWVIDINMNELQKVVFEGLIHKPFPLTGKEIRFMRKFLELSTVDFAKKLGISHATVVKWEKEQAKISAIQESYLRIFLLELLKDNELLNLYKEIRPEKLAEARNIKPIPIHVNAKQLHRAY